MSIEADLITYLNSSTAITAYVGTRIFADKRPQRTSTGSTDLGALPNITVHTISGGEEDHLTGAAPHGIPRVQLSIWAQTRIIANDIREALRQRLQGFPQAQQHSGVWGSTTIVGSVVFQSGPFLYEDDDVGGSMGIAHQPVDLLIWFKQPVPTT